MIISWVRSQHYPLGAAKSQGPELLPSSPIPTQNTLLPVSLPSLSLKIDFKHLAQTSILFSNSKISALKNQFNGHKTSRIHAVASCLWRARTRPLMKPSDMTRLLIPIDTRFQYKPSLPKGFYENAMVFPSAIAKADDLTGKPLQYAAHLISEARRGVMGDENRASVLDFIEVNEHGGSCMEGTTVITDLSNLRLGNMNLGYGPGVWGEWQGLGLCQPPGC